MAKQLVILWTQNSEVTFTEMILPYLMNSKLKGWWPKATLIIWGGSTQLVRDTPMIQESIQGLVNHSITVRACRSCANHLTATALLESLGVDVCYMGVPLTDYLQKDDVKLLSL